jgi:hypothetical protein
MGLIIVENDKKLNYFNAYDYCWIFKESGFWFLLLQFLGASKLIFLVLISLLLLRILEFP